MGPNWEQQKIQGPDPTPKNAAVRRNEFWTLACGMQQPVCSTFYRYLVTSGRERWQWKTLLPDCRALESSLQLKVCFYRDASRLKQWLHLKLNWNKTETKQFCFSFISDVVTCEVKQKQNTETILKCFRIVLELFYDYFRFISHVTMAEIKL